MKNKTPFLIAILAFILRIMYASPYLEDWDSVQFSLAINHFSIIQHLPQPPGYPIYIFIGKIMNFFINDPAQSMILISIALGSLMVIPFYLLLKDMTQNEHIATLFTIILIVTPVQWTLSEVALSNIPGMFFLLTSVYFIYKGRESERFLLIGSFLAGITLGVRFMEYSILLSLIALVLIYRRGRTFLYTITSLSVGIFIWLIPLIILTGINNFIQMYFQQAQYIYNHDSLLKEDSGLKFRLRQIWLLFSYGYTYYFVPIIMLIEYQLIRKRRQILNFDYVFTITWLISFMVPLIFVYNLEVTRHILPLAVPLLLLAGVLSKKISSKYLYCGSLIIIIALFFQSLSQVSALHTLIPPTIQPIIYIKNNYKPEQVLIISTITYRHFQYYAPEFDIIQGNNLPVDIKNKEIIVLDYQGLEKMMPELKKYRIEKKLDFDGPKIIFPRVSHTTLYVYKRIGGN